MNKMTAGNLAYGLRHPLKSFRYLIHRDQINYDICARYLPKAPIIVEAGAFDGTNTGEFCRYWTKCQVYAFEPIPSAYERLLMVAQAFPNQINPQKMALGNCSENSKMHVSKTGDSGGEQSSSLLVPSATLEEFPFVQFQESTIPVMVTRLDDWTLKNNVDKIDFLWLDLQGMELAALEGCGEILLTVKAIHCEVQNIPLYEGSPVYSEVSNWLKAKGFKVACEAVFRRGGNVLFVRE
jgi:FkbM family methyltransferase